LVLTAFAGLLFLTVAAVNLIPADHYKLALTTAVNAATGHKLTIAGDLISI
jgi:hypothetical protein